MLRCCKSLSSNFRSILIRQRFLIQRIRHKSSRGFAIRESDEEDDDEDVCNSGTEEKAEKGKIHLLKSRGQHLLTNPRVLDTIVRKSDIKPTDTVLEIGPGTGNLTLKLLEAAKNVIAIEIGKRMVEILHERVAERGFETRLTVRFND